MPAALRIIKNAIINSMMLAISMNQIVLDAIGTGYQEEPKLAAELSIK